MSYKAYPQAILPPPLQGPNGVRWARGLAAHLDRLVSDSRDAVKRRMPELVGREGDALALGYLGGERDLPRYPSESDAAYGQRLQGAWVRWQRAGARDARETALAALGYTHVKIWTVLDDGAPDGNATWWSRFWIFIGAGGHPYSPTAITYGEPGRVFGGPNVFGMDASAEEMDSLRSAIRRWKPALSYCVAAHFFTGGIYFGQAGKTFGGPDIFGGQAIIVGIEF